MTLNEIFSTLLCGEQAEVCVTAKQYASLRVSVLRKFKSTADLSASVDLPDYVGKYVRCSYNSKTYTATFVIASTDAKLSRAADYSSPASAEQL